MDRVLAPSWMRVQSRAPPPPLAKATRMVVAMVPPANATQMHLAMVPPKRIAALQPALHVRHPPTMPPPPWLLPPRQPTLPPPPWLVPPRPPCIDEDLLSQLARCREVVERAVRLNARPIQKARPKARRAARPPPEKSALEPEMPKDSGPNAEMPQEQMPLDKKQPVPKPGDAKSGIGEKRTWAVCDRFRRRQSLRQSGSNKFRR